MTPVDYAEQLRAALLRAGDAEWDIQAVGSVVEARHNCGALLRIAAAPMEMRHLGWHRRLLGAAGGILRIAPTEGLLLLCTKSAGGQRCMVTLLRPGSGAVVGEWMVIQRGIAA